MNSSHHHPLTLILKEAFSISDKCDFIEDDTLKSAAQTTFENHVTLIGIIRPTKREFIAKALNHANHHDFHILPVSSNKNWGYGCIDPSRVNKPVVMLDLQNLKGITPTDKNLGLITLEPGVTQKELRRYLDKHDWNHMVPVTGAGPSCSIVSNALERGYGITPHTDHFLASTALKAYVAHPDLCETELSSAVSELDQSGSDFIDKSFKWGLGPYIDGLFTQSNLGIVSEMTFRLAKVPSKFNAFYIQIFDDAKFENAVAFINNILERYSGSVGSINLMDRRRLLSMTVENPNLNKTNNTYLTDQQVNELATKNKTPEWLIVGSIYGEKDIVNVVKKSIKREAKSLGKLLFSDDFLLKTASKLLKFPITKIPLLGNIKAQLDKLDQGIEIMLGKPNQIALPLAYWRNQSVRPSSKSCLNPAADNCGLLWYAPLVKMNSNSLREFVIFVRLLVKEFDFDPFVTFTNLRHDCIDATVPLVFNLEDAQETQRAKACLSALIDQGLKKGFVPYRLSAEQQQRVCKKPMYWQCVEQIKQALDPNEVISPGRYN